MQKYNSSEEHFAKVAYKNHLHSANNPYSQFRDVYTLEQIKKSPKVHGPLTKLQCCPTSDGSAACVLANENFVIKHGLQNQAVEIVDIVMKTDPKSTFEDKSLMKLAGYDMTKLAADELYKRAKLNKEDILNKVGAVELHDCFSANELISYEGLGLCPEGKAGDYIDKNLFTYGGKVVVNPSGGLISKGHPLGATGLAQCAELCWQLRNMAMKRQIGGMENKLALQHNLGLGGACVVALYKRYNPTVSKGYSRKDQTSDPDVLEEIEKMETITPKL